MSKTSEHIPDDSQQCAGHATSPASTSQQVSAPLQSLEPMRHGVYESDDIQWILSHPLANFGPKDAVIFDIDDVLITQRLDPFLLEHAEKESPLWMRFSSLEQHVRDKFFSYLRMSESPSTIALMDERTPLLISTLQSNGVRCLANTAQDQKFEPLNMSLDQVSVRIAMLRSLGIDFSHAFPDLAPMDCDALGLSRATKYTPTFKEGIMFSSSVPKHITQEALFNRVSTIPQRLVYVDDRMTNVQAMHDSMSALGIECYSFCYSQHKTKPFLSYFSDTVFREELQRLETFAEKLLRGEDTDRLCFESYFGRFVSHLSTEYRGEEPDRLCFASYFGKFTAQLGIEQRESHIQDTSHVDGDHQHDVEKVKVTGELAVVSDTQ